MADIKYDIVKEIGVLSEYAKGWRKETNLISWNGGEPKYDIRSGIDHLAGIIETQTGNKPFVPDTLYLFCPK